VNAIGSTARSADGPAADAVDAAVFRRVIGNFASGVVVITTSVGGRRSGATVSAVSSLSLDPPMLLACLHSASSTQEAVREAGVFAVNVLAEDQAAVAALFARPSDGTDKFAGVPVREGRTGVPVLGGTLATIECRVQEVVPGGTHRVFLSRVVHAEATEGSPLAYFRGTMGKLEMRQDAEAYAEIRRLVLTRTLGPGAALDVQALAEQLRTSASAVFYALTRLVGENLIVRDPERGHVVRPLSAAESDDAHDAKLVIELGAAELTVGRLTADQLDQFAALAEATSPHVVDGRLADVEPFIAANAEFHAYPIRTSGIDALLQAYDRLSLSDMMSRALSSGLAFDPRIVEDHRALVGAYRLGDLGDAKRIIMAHNERAKQTQRSGIESAGGTV
jgi:4-nitrophenol 2-monooxygenase / 4-nitrocatechol 4-monooxygenase, reductase component